MKKVLILNHGLANGGTDTFCLNVIKGLDKGRYEVSFAMAVDKNSEPQFHENEVRAMGIPIHKICDLGGVKRVILFSVGLYKLLKREKPDVFHANMDLFNGINMFVAWLAHVPVRVCHSHNSQSQYEANSGKHLMARIYRGLMRKLIWVFSNRRCGCSEEAMDYLFTKKWKNDKKSYVIHNGIDISLFEEPVDRVPVLDELGGLNPSKKYLISVGRLEEQKNPLFIVEIMKSICELRDDIELLWVGTGAMQSIVEKKIHDYKLSNKIHLLGARKDVYRIMKCAEVFLLPSLFEGLGIVLLEAQASGLNCIASNTVPRLVDCGRVLFLPINEGTSAWIGAISDILDGKSERHLDDKLIREFGVKNMINQLEKVYEE